MEIKIGRYIIDDISDNDWVLDNGACYQMMTRNNENHSPFTLNAGSLIISKKQFTQLIKDGLLIRYDELENTERFQSRYWGKCKAWRFHIS